MQYFCSFRITNGLRRDAASSFYENLLERCFRVRNWYSGSHVFRDYCRTLKAAAGVDGVPQRRPNSSNSLANASSLSPSNRLNNLQSNVVRHHHDHHHA